MKRGLFLLLPMLAIAAVAPAFAGGSPQTDPVATAKQLDLSLPSQPSYSFQSSDPNASTDNVVARRIASASSNSVQRGDGCDGKPHGSVSAGVGVFSRGGTGNWQALQLGTCKRTYNDEGQARTFGMSISVGQSSVRGRGLRSWPMRGF